MTYHGYADYLAVMGDCAGSVEQTLQGRRHDPMGVWANLFVVGHLVMCHRYEEAIRQGRTALEVGVESKLIGLYLGHALWFLGRYEEAIDEWRIVRGSESPFVQALERGYAEGGPRAAMLAVADSFAAAAATRPIDPLDVATYYAVAAERDPAFEWLERAYERKAPQLLHLTFVPYFDPIRDDPRFDDLLRRIGIPE
jgi:tetratricopeptide (TPR) repeat protein